MKDEGRHHPRAVRYLPFVDSVERRRVDQGRKEPPWSTLSGRYARGKSQMGRGSLFTVVVLLGDSVGEAKGEGAALADLGFDPNATPVVLHDGFADVQA